MPELIQLSIEIPVSARRIYEAWLNSEEHAAFTGGEATVDPNINGEYTAWDGYIQGKTIELEPYKRIVQTWRTTDFLESSPDSRLEVLLEEAEGGTKVTLIHSNIPQGQARLYEQGWKDFYFEPMKQYFQKG